MILFFYHYNFTFPYFPILQYIHIYFSLKVIIDLIVVIKYIKKTLTTTGNSKSFFLDIQITTQFPFLYTIYLTFLLIS